MREDIASILLSEEQIRTRVRELGEEISRDYAGKEPLFVGVLKGCFIFMADLFREVTAAWTLWPFRPTATAPPPRAR